jgi:hypothetical protein
VSRTLFQNGRGHLAGAMMITSGAIANVTKVRVRDGVWLCGLIASDQQQ